MKELTNSILALLLYSPFLHIISSTVLLEKATPPLFSGMTSVKVLFPL